MEGKGGVILANVDEIEHIVVILNKVFNKKGGSKERVGVKVAGIHVYEEDEFRES